MKFILLQAVKTLGDKLSSRRILSVSLMLVLLTTSAGMIFYVQKTLLEIEKAMPITLSKQERDIRVLVYEMGRLVSDIEFARVNNSLIAFGVVLRQIDAVEQHLVSMADRYRFNDLLGVSAIHAKINPAVFDIKTWLTEGILNFEPTSAHILRIAHERSKLTHEELELMLKKVASKALDVLTAQARRIEIFRTIMVATLIALSLMSIGLILQGLRLQSIVVALKSSEDQIRYRANYDSLTRLPNRANFVEHLDEAIIRDRRHHGLMALLFIDLDRFKTINDTLGHDYGDDLIKQVAARIKQATRETDMVSRLGGDEFTVLLTNVTDEIHASIIAKNILEQLSRPYMLENHEVYTSASIGITISPNDGIDAHTLLKNADMAMYEAKERGRNTFRFFTSQMTERVHQFMKLDKDMRRALNQDELDVHFQPIYAMRDHSLVGVEALLRWHHPQKGLILPSDFISVAEETGLIEDLGLWVLRRSCTRALAWLKLGVDSEFYLSVNISMRQFKGGFDRKQLQAVLDETGYPADRLLLEITESLLMDNDARTRDVLAEFREMGVRLAVDDFGTGYSALNYLREFPVSTLKIDRSFVHDIDLGPSQCRLVEGIIALAHGLDLVTIAEGVESTVQNTLLTELKCDMVQGFLHCEPMSEDEISLLLARSCAADADSARFDIVDNLIAFRKDKK